MLHHAAVQGAQTTLHAGGMSESNGSGYWGAVARKLLLMGPGRVESLRSGEAVGNDAQPMGGWAMRGHFKPVQLHRSNLKSALQRIRSLD